MYRAGESRPPAGLDFPGVSGTLRVSELRGNWL